MRELQFIQRILTDLAPFVRHRHADRATRCVETKSHAADLLTETDLEVQRRIHAALAAEFPDDVLVAEEGDAQQPPPDPNARCWVLDPIDGTHNFVKGVMPAFGVTLAFVENARPVAGGIIFPAIHELLLAQRGGPATRNGQPICVSNNTELAGCKIECDFGRPQMRPESLQAFHPVLLSAGQIRCHGCAVLSLADVASGEAEAYIHVGLSPWDFAGGMAIIEAAGGVVTRLDGSPINLFDGRKGLLAANPVLHRKLAAQINAPR